MAKELLGNQRLSRRTFLATTLKAAGSLTALSLLPAGIFSAEPKAANLSKLVIARHPRMISAKLEVDRGLVKALLDNGMVALTGEKKAKDAWASLINPSPADVVGIKVSCLGGRNLQSHPVLVYAIIDRLKSIGVAENNIIIWERRDDELQRCGYQLNSSSTGIRCYGTLPTRRFDKKVSMLAGKEIQFSNILANEITKLINVPVLKDHGVPGVSGALKNNYGSFNVPWQFHGNNGDPYIAQLNALPEIKDKTVAIICDAIRPLCHGGPSDRPKYRWNFGGLLLSQDPVALDYTGWQIIQEQRKTLGLMTLEAEGRSPKYIFSAEKLQLGFARPDKIQQLNVSA